MTTTNPPNFDPDEAIVAVCWPLAKVFVADPCADDAPVADRLRAISVTVVRAREQRSRFGNLPPGLDKLVSEYEEATRRARPEVKIDPPRHPSPVYDARIRVALASTASETARMPESAAAALDAVCSGTPHQDLRRSIDAATEAFTAALEAEISSIPRVEREALARSIDTRRIAEETAALRTVSVVPGDGHTGSEVRWPTRADNSRVTVAAAGPIGGAR